MKKTFRYSLLTLAIGLSMTANIAQAKDIQFGFIGPLTGPNTQYGDMVREGLKTAVELANAKGGVNGEKIKIVEFDDGCEPKQGPSSANDAIKAGVKFVVGPVCTGATLGSTPILDQQGVVAITPSATAPEVTDGKNFEFIFRTIGRDDQQGPFAADYIANTLKPKKIAILHDKQSYGQGIAEAVDKELTKHGIKVALFTGINAGESDYSSVITKLKGLGVDFVYFGGYYPELGLLLRQAHEQGLKAQFMSDEGGANQAIKPIAGDALEGLITSVPADYSTDPQNADVVKAFKEKHRDPSGTFQLSSFAATQAIIAGIEATKSDDPEKVAEWLHKNKVHTVMGDISWNKQGDLNQVKFDLFKWHKDGSRTKIE